MSTTPALIDCRSLPNSARLWKPAPLLQELVQNILPDLNIKPAKGLDIACGAGRDLVYLATQGWEMTGIDYSEDSLQRAQVLAAAESMAVTTVLRDLEKSPTALVDFDTNAYSLIHVSRYLHRPLLPKLPRLLQKGGLLVYQTFMSGCENTAIGRPSNPRFLLKQGELAHTYAQANILLDRIDYLEDGRPVNAFIARFGR